MKLSEVSQDQLAWQKYDERERLLKRVLMDVSRLTPHPFKLTQLIKSDIDPIATRAGVITTKRYVSQADEHEGSDRVVQVAYHQDPDIFIYFRGFTMPEQTSFFENLSDWLKERATLKRSKSGWAHIKVKG